MLARAVPHRFLFSYPPLLAADFFTLSVMAALPIGIYCTLGGGPVRDRTGGAGQWTGEY